MDRLIVILSQITGPRLILAMMLSGIYYYFNGFDSGQGLDKKLQQIKIDIVAQETKEKETDEVLKKREAVQAEVALAGQRYQEATARLPAEIAVSDILVMVDTIARTAGVVIKTKEPQKPVKKDFIEEIPLKVILEGSFAETMVFFYYMSALERITRMGDINITIVPGTQKLKVEGQVISYRFVGAGAGS